MPPPRARPGRHRASTRTGRTTGPEAKGTNISSVGPQAKGRRPLDHPDQSWSSPDSILGVLFEGPTNAISQFKFKPLKCACRQSTCRPAVRHHRHCGGGVGSSPQVVLGPGLTKTPPRRDGARRLEVATLGGSVTALLDQRRSTATDFYQTRATLRKTALN